MWGKYNVTTKDTKKAEQSGLNLIAITDHNAVVHSILLNRLKEGEYG
ncbi:MAG: hypothetical protein GX240_05245 [Candidatus Atribacteria bacterium]|nr:hypothetical protein [Candidatus Atribacteria bacterium]